VKTYYTTYKEVRLILSWMHVHTLSWKPHGVTLRAGTNHCWWHCHYLE